MRRWARHSVRCWSHATEGAQTRHVAGSRSQQRLLRASASFTDASRSSCWWPRLSGAGCAGMWATWCGDARVWSTPLGERPGDHVRAEGAAGDGHRAARGPRWACSSARASATRPEMPQVSGEGSKMSQHSRPQVRALRASRGLPGYEGDCHGSRRRPAPTRRARRAHNRAWACWALASGRPPHREERAGVRCAPSRLRPVPGAGSSRARAALMPLVLLPPPRGVHIGRALGLGCASRGSGAPRGPPRSSATPARAEHVRARTRGGALGGPGTHPVTPRTLGARVVGVLGPPAGA